MDITNVFMVAVLAIYLGMYVAWGVSWARYKAKRRKDMLEYLKVWDDNLNHSTMEDNHGHH